MFIFHLLSPNFVGRNKMSDHTILNEKCFTKFRKISIFSCSYSLKKKNKKKTINKQPSPQILIFVSHEKKSLAHEKKSQLILYYLNGNTHKRDYQNGNTHKRDVSECTECEIILCFCVQ